MARVVVTGAFGFSGKYVARRLLDAGHAVHTLTNSPDRGNPFGGRVTASPLQFDETAKLSAALAGADALINTYWVRVDHRDFTHAQAVANTRALFATAPRPDAVVPVDREGKVVARAAGSVPYSGVSSIENGGASPCAIRRGGSICDRLAYCSPL